MAKNHSSFLSKTTCCLQEMSLSEEQLHRHYWQFIQNQSHDSSTTECYSKHDDVQQTLEKAAELRKKFCYTEGGESNISAAHHFIKPAGLSYKSSCEVTEPIVYADGIPVEGIEFPITSSFSFSRIKTILDMYEPKIPGLSYPYLYVGATHATFPWHIEDYALFSINYLHFGAPCVWYIVPPSDYKHFSDLIQFLPLDCAQVVCRNVLGHKYVVASPHFLRKFNMTVHTVIPKEGEVVIVYPFASHSGFKTGRNISQAINFGDEWWIEPAILAPTCECFPYQIQMDLMHMIAVTRPHLLQLYIDKNIQGLFVAIGENDFIKKLKLIPAIAHAVKPVSEATNTAIVLDNVHHVEKHESNDQPAEVFKGSRGAL